MHLLFLYFIFLKFLNYINNNFKNNIYKNEYIIIIKIKNNNLYNYLKYIYINKNEIIK